VVVYSVGVGTPAGSEIQMINEQGRLDLLRDSRGEVVRSRLDEPTLSAIAKATKGAYFPLGPLGEGLTRVRLASEELGAGAGAAPARKLGIDRFHFPLTLVILLLVAESLLGTRRRRNRTLVPSGSSASVAVAFIALAFCRVDVQASPAAPMKPREIYNAGTQQLEKGKLREAENLLEAATATQDESIQPRALYNLGHVRYLQGEESLKKAPPAKPTLRQGNSAVANSQAALKTAEDALQLKELRSLVNAYLNGRGARRELNAAIKAVRNASETYGTALSRWQRASGDFKSAHELNPRDADAKANADRVDRNIARLIDSLRELQTMSGMLSNMKKELGQKLDQLKGQIPEQDMPPGAEGDEDEEDEITPKDLEGKEESPSKEGKEMELTPEQAGWLLEAFRLDKERRLPMGEGPEGKPQDRNKPTW
jgi:Ca-activated chloride channel family protein